MKKVVIALLVLVITTSALVYANEDSTVFTVESSLNAEVVMVDVAYDHNKMMCGGGFTLVYDNAKLSLIDAIEGSALSSGTMFVINEKLAENKIRIVWAGTKVMPETGEILKVTFKLNLGEFKKSDIGVENFGIANENGQTIKTASMSVKGVEGSTIYSGQVTKTENKKEETPVTETKPEDLKPVEDSKPTADEAPKADSADTQKPEVNETDETLPLDKVPSEEEAALGFDDVAESDWFFNSVKYAKENKLMSGVSETEFAPNDSVTRAMLVVVLHRIEGEPKIGDAAFTDVESGQWYTNAVAWAANEGIVNGVGDGKFAPNADITREQIATILYKYSQKKDMVGATAVYFDAPDKNKISDWAMEGMSWAISEKLITGKDGGVLDPGGKATRAEIATILMRFLNK